MATVEVTDYFVRNSNWTHLWVTLRNLADLLRGLATTSRQALLDAAADRPRMLPPSTALPAPNRRRTPPRR